MVVKAKFLNKYISNFHSGLEETTFIPTASDLKVQSYIDENNEGLQTVLQTCYSIENADFDEYLVVPECQGQQVTFCLKELKAMLTFCESLDESIHLFFNNSGDPILLSTSAYGLQNSITYAADIVVATLQNDDEE